MKIAIVQWMDHCFFAMELRCCSVDAARAVHQWSPSLGPAAREALQWLRQCAAGSCSLSHSKPQAVTAASSSTAMPSQPLSLKRSRLKTAARDIRPIDVLFYKHGLAPSKKVFLHSLITHGMSECLSPVRNISSRNVSPAISTPQKVSLKRSRLKGRDIGTPQKLTVGPSLQGTLKRRRVCKAHK